MRVRGWVYRSKVNWKKVKGPYTSRVPIARVRALLEYEAMADPETRTRFEGWANGEYRDIRFEVDLAIARKMGRYFELSRYGSPNLRRFFKAAEKMTQTGSPQEAIPIYKGITESLGVHMDLIPDKSGDCYIMMQEALEEMAKCILAAYRNDEIKRRREIKYLAEWSMRVIDWYAADYGLALKMVCQNAKDLDIWEAILDDPPKVEEDYSGPSGYGSGELRKILNKQRTRITDA